MWWLVILATGLFMVVSVLPCCKGKEILWIFVGWGICAVPVNIHLLYDHQDYIGCFVDEWDAIFLPLLMIIFVVMEVAEEMIVLAIGRMVWPEQDEMFLNFVEEEDMDEKTGDEGTVDKETVDKETEDEEEKEVEEEKAEANSEPEPGLKSYYLGRYLISDGMHPVQTKVEAPIEWIPLTTKGDQTLLLAKQCLAWEFYGTTDFPSYLENNVIDKLYGNCLSEEEKQAVIEQPAGNWFLLSEEEAERYLTTEELRRADIAFSDCEDDVIKIRYTNSAYWLHNEKEDNSYAWDLGWISAIDEVGEKQLLEREDEEVGIRPAMYVNTKKAREISAKNRCDKSQCKMPEVF